MAVITENQQTVTRQELLRASAEDGVLQQLRDQLQRPWPLRESLCSTDLRPYYRCREELTVVGDVVLRGSARVVVPAALRSRVLGLAHEVHQGIVKTKQRIRELYWWPGIDQEVERLVKTCPICSAADKTASPRRAPMQPVPFPSEPWVKLGLDFIGPMAGGRPCQRFAIVCIDYHSKWIEVGFCAHPTTEVVVTFLEKLASREGYPEEVVSDCGSVFMSDQFARYLRSVGIKHVRVTPYHPQASGQVERANKLVKSALQTASLEKVDWTEYLQLFLLNYRSTVQATTGRSPAELLHGRRMRTKLHVAAERPEVSSEQARSRNGLLARVRGKQRKQKAYFDRNNHVREPKFRVGDWVRWRLLRRQRKGKPRFSKPTQVAAVRGPASYVLADGSRVHAEALVPCWGRRGAPHRPPTHNEPLLQVPADPELAGASGELAGTADDWPTAVEGGGVAPSPGRPGPGGVADAPAPVPAGDAAASLDSGRTDAPAQVAAGGGAAAPPLGLQLSPGPGRGSDEPALVGAGDAASSVAGERAAGTAGGAPVPEERGGGDAMRVTRSGRVVRPPNRL